MLEKYKEPFTYVSFDLSNAFHQVQEKEYQLLVRHGAIKEVNKECETCYYRPRKHKYGVRTISNTNFNSIISVDLVGSKKSKGRKVVQGFSD